MSYAYFTFLKHWGGWDRADRLLPRGGAPPNRSIKNCNPRCPLLTRVLQRGGPCASTEFQNGNTRVPGAPRCAAARRAAP
eukprot:12427411-Karenia_brevis.AAC.1